MNGKPYANKTPLFTTNRLLAILTLLVSTTYLSGCSQQDSSQISKDSPPAISAEEQEVANLRKQAESGDENAQYELGARYYKGVVVVKDPKLAAEWWMKAAEQSHAAAQLEIGKLYYFGKGSLAKDEIRAVSYFEKASANGNMEATYRLGQAYDSGKGVTKDPARAVELWRKAAESGNALAQSSLGKAYFYGTGGIEKDERAALSWFEKAIAQNDPNVNRGLGLSFLTGWGAPKDEQKAYDLTLRAANSGDIDAQSHLCHLFTNVRSLAFEMKNRSTWCMKAAEAGDPQSQYELGTMYLSGDGMPRDDLKAAEYLSKAAIQGHGSAQFQLASLYLSGKGVESDRIVAYVWFNLSASSTDVADLANGIVDMAKRQRDVLTKQMSPEEIKEGQQISSNWKKGQQLPRGSGAGASSSITAGVPVKRSTGTAFYVTKHGAAVTNHHVVAGCTELRMEGKGQPIKVVTSDVVNDLALLNVGFEVSTTAPLAKDPSQVRQGEEIVVFGFPLNSVLSSGGNLTPGVVSATTGLGNNTNQLQITAPIQPGSSGSPVMNKKAEVVAVVSMKLSDAKMAKATGSIGQNVNFAVSGQTLRAFLDANKVEYKTGGMLTFEKSTADIAEEAKKWTTVVECWK